MRDAGAGLRTPMRSERALQVRPANLTGALMRIARRRDRSTIDL
jgi:hypothetical protein